MLSLLAGLAAVLVSEAGLDGLSELLRDDLALLQLLGGVLEAPLTVDGAELLSALLDVRMRETTEKGQSRNLMH